MKERILFVTNLLPYPLDNGGKIKTYNTLCVLKEIYDIDLLCFIEDDNDLTYIKELERLGINLNCVKKILRHAGKPYLLLFEVVKSLFSRYPYIISKFLSKEMHKLIRVNALKNKYKYIYIDHLQLFPYFYDAMSVDRKVKVILDQHNVESQIVQRRLNNSRNLFSKLFLILEYWKALLFEKSACKRADIVLAITEQDKVKILELTCGKCNCHVSPYVMKREEIKFLGNCNEKIILFIGTMSWYPNEDGLLWFYNNVFKAFDLGGKGWKLIVVGNSPTKRVLKLADDSFVKVTGYVDDVTSYIQKSLLSVVPLRIGGGMRIKILDLFKWGVPVISTDIGCEGIPASDNKSILIANSPEEFLKKINLFEQNERLRENLVENAFKLIDEKYSFERARGQFQEILNSTK